jgi:predicted RND superfamily exporter protein
VAELAKKLDDLTKELVAKEKIARSLQSSRDSQRAEYETNVATIQRRNDELEAKLMALTNDPEERLRLVQAQYEARDQVRQAQERTKSQVETARTFYTTKLHVPPELLRDAMTLQDLEDAASDYVQGLSKTIETVKRVEKIKEIEDSGAHDVTLSPGVSPNPVVLSQTETQKRLDEIKAASRKNDLSRREREALQKEFLKLRGSGEKKPKTKV